MKIVIHTILSIKDIFGTRIMEFELHKSATTIGELLNMLDVNYKLSSKLLKQYGLRMNDIIILVNGRDVYVINGLNTELNDNDHCIITSSCCRRLTYSV